MPKKIGFDRDRHEYAGGVPSVTDILQDVGIIDAGFFTDGGAERGRLVHLICEYYDLGVLDESTVDPAFAGYFAAYKSYRSKNQIKMKWIEESLVDPSGLYCGTPDRPVVTRPRRMIDIKTGDPQDWHKIQLAGYVGMFRDPFSFTREGLYLQDSGSFRVITYPLDELVRDLAVFNAALTIYNFRKGK